MNRRASLISLALAATILAAGCGSTASQTATPASPATRLSLATSLATATGTWAVAVLGGSAASHNNFWQLFVRPAGARRWRLATPPGVASNGGLVLAGLASGAVLAGFRPSQDLSYSPLATTKDNGKAWTPSLLDAGLADVAGALAADPASGRLLALLTGGTAEISGSGGTAWTRLASRHTLAASAPGRRCGLGGLTAAAFSPSGTPLLAASCVRPRTAGIFAYADGAWHSTGPALPASYARQSVTTLQLTTTGRTITALLAAGSESAARVLAAWSADGGTHWNLSPPLPLRGARPTSASFGPGGAVAVVMTGGHAESITSTAGSWRPLPALPARTATLAPSPSGGWDALAVHRAKLAIWRLANGTGAWASTQAIKIPIAFGSSG